MAITTPKAGSRSRDDTGSPGTPARKGRRGTLYRGREGMWSWVAHRITGVLIFFFLFAHVLDTALLRVSKSSYNTVIGSYKNPITNFLEYGLTAAIVFHAFNGLRIIAVDFWAKGPRYQKRMLWIVVGVWAALMAGMLYPITAHSWHTIFGK
jgi:succinate dehydrogenase / fumarate reductase cytochrome b subunit